MRIALCFSGMMRTFDECLPTVVKHVVESNPEHEFHSFIASWLERGKVDKSAPVTWASVTKDMEYVDTRTIMAFPGLNVKAVRLDAFQGSDFMKQVDRDVNGKYSARRNPGQSNLYNMLPMFKKMDQCHRLFLENVENGIQYDMIVKCRLDLFFTGDIKFQHPEGRTLYLPNHERWGPGALNDQFYYGDPNVMSYMACMWNNLDNYYESKQELHPETYYHDWIERAQIRKVHLDMPYRILR